MGAGTIMEEIISSFMEDSEGGGGQTRLSMISSVVFMSEARSGGSVLDDLFMQNYVTMKLTCYCRHYLNVTQNKR